MKKTHSRKGFTLIELMVVIVIIAILAGIAVASFVQASKSARDGKRKADLETMRQALLLYRQENGEYPDADPGASQNILTPGQFNTVSDLLVTEKYLSAPAPRDPGSTTYTYGAIPTVFCMCARLETNSGNSPGYGQCDEITTGNNQPNYCVRSP